ncbi:MAG: NnrS family protein [Chromatiales bacterium]|nr:NnrS family protein [Chromatiales bacterium]
MSLLNMTEKPDFDPKAWVPFALGFRPFFILAGLSGFALLFLWLMFWHKQFSAASYYGLIGWHSHEMLFGYTLAVVAGFLLTAVRNWTGVNTITNTPLALLALLWLLGRLLPWIPGLPGWLIMIVDLAFIPLLAVALIYPLWQGRNKINRVFVPILLSMFIANLLVHSEAMGWTNTATLGIDLVLHIILLLIVMVGGRVMPFFTQNVIPGFTSTSRKWVEVSSFVSIILVALAALFMDKSPLLGVLYIAFATIQAIRLQGWYHNDIWDKPVLWVLHTGYAWLIIGALLMGLSNFGLFMVSAAKHALTAGAIGVITLGMMARVARGHSGRDINVTKPIAWAFVLINIAVALRVFGPDLLPQHYLIWIMSSGTFWLIAFGIFTVAYLPILIHPRVDGQPG